MFGGSLNGTWGTLVSSNPYNHGNTSFSQGEAGLSNIYRTHSRKAGLGVLESTPGFSQMIRTAFLIYALLWWHQPIFKSHCKQCCIKCVAAIIIWMVLSVDFSLWTHVKHFYLVSFRPHIFLLSNRFDFTLDTLRAARKPTGKCVASSICIL